MPCIAGDGYCLQIARQQPVAELRGRSPHRHTLPLGSGVDTMDGRRRSDPARSPGAPARRRCGRHLGRPTAPDGGQTGELRAWDAGFSYGTTVQGQGSIDRVHLWRRAPQRPAAATCRLFNPEPNSGDVQYSGQRCTPASTASCVTRALVPERVYTGPPDFMTISVGRDKDYHDGNWFFTPSPFCYAVEGDGNWLGLGVAAEPGGWNSANSSIPARGSASAWFTMGTRPWTASGAARDWSA